MYLKNNYISNVLNLLHPRKDVAEMVIVFCVSLIVVEDLMFVMKYVYQKWSFFVSPLVKKWAALIKKFPTISMLHWMEKKLLPPRFQERKHPEERTPYDSGFTKQKNNWAQCKKVNEG